MTQDKKIREPSDTKLRPFVGCTVMLTPTQPMHLPGVDPSGRAIGPVPELVGTDHENQPIVRPRLMDYVIGKVIEHRRNDAIAYGVRIEVPLLPPNEKGEVDVVTSDVFPADHTIANVSLHQQIRVERVQAPEEPSRIVLAQS